MGIYDIVMYTFIPVGLVAVFRPEWLLYLFLIAIILTFVPHAIADFDVLEIFRFGSIHLYLQDYLMLMLMLVFLKSCFQRSKEFFSVLETPVSKAVVILFLWEVFIGFLSFSKGFTLANVLRRLSVESLMFIAILVPLVDLKKEDRKRLFRFAILMGGILILLGLLKYAVFHEVEITSSGTKRSLTGKAVPTLLFSLCYILFYRGAWRRRPLLSGLFILLIMVGITFAGHRSGWIVFLFVLSMWFLHSPDKISFAWIPMWAVAMGLMMIIGFYSLNVRAGTFYGDLFVRISDTFNAENRSTKSRVETLHMAVDVLKENPALGLGRYPLYSYSADRENLVSAFRVVLAHPSHNIIASRVINEGLAGLSMLLIFFYVIFKQFKGASAFREVEYGNFLKVFLMAFILYAMFNTTFDNVNGKILFFTTVGLLNHAISLAPQLIRERGAKGGIDDT